MAIPLLGQPHYSEVYSVAFADFPDCSFLPVAANGNASAPCQPRVYASVLAGCWVPSSRNQRCDRTVVALRFNMDRQRGGNRIFPWYGIISKHTGNVLVNPEVCCLCRAVRPPFVEYGAALFPLWRTVHTPQGIGSCDRSGVTSFLLWNDLLAQLAGCGIS